MRGAFLTVLSLLAALCLCACVHYVPRETSGTAASTTVPQETTAPQDGTDTTVTSGEDSTLSEPTETDEGFPNEAEPDGTKRY